MGVGSREECEHSFGRLLVVGGGRCRQGEVVDVDDETTWPPSIRKFVFEVAHASQGDEDSLADGDLADLRQAFCRIIAGHPMMVLHCTRLLDHEVYEIRDSGLSVASQDLVENRINAAFERGQIGSDERAELLRNTVFRHGDASNRIGQVCFVLGRSDFDDRPNNVWHYLTEWGGELLSNGSKEIRPVLRRIGRPAIVVAGVDLSVHCPSFVHDRVLRSFITAKHGRAAASGIYYRDSVGSNKIIDIWQPGHAEYDRHSQLPR